MMRVATWYLPGTWYMVGHTIIVVGGRQFFYVLGTYYYAGIRSFLLCKPTIRGIYPLAVDLSRAYIAHYGTRYLRTFYADL